MKKIIMFIIAALGIVCGVIALEFGAYIIADKLGYVDHTEEVETHTIYEKIEPVSGSIPAEVAEEIIDKVSEAIASAGTTTETTTTTAVETKPECLVVRYNEPDEFHPYGCYEIRTDNTYGWYDVGFTAYMLGKFNPERILFVGADVPGSYSASKILEEVFSGPVYYE